MADFDSNTTIYRYEESRQGFIGPEVFHQVMFINHGVVTFIIAIVGIGANIANIATFIRQGFKETIDVTLMALAFSDCASLIFLLWMSICYNPSFCDLVCDVINLEKIEYLTAAAPRAYLTIVSGYITSIVAFERCLCVLKPLQVKVLFTKKRLRLIIICVFVLVGLPFIPLYITSSFGWFYNPATNGSIISVTRKEHMAHIDSACFAVMVALCLITYLAVSVFTAIIVLKLASQRAWRSKESQNAGTVSSGDSKDNSKLEGSNIKKVGISVRDKRATKTVTFVATMYIVCFFPGAALLLTMSLVPDFNKGKVYNNLFDMTWTFAVIGEGICSSANILVYLKTSTRFRETFLSFFKATSADRN